jgi:hypothetical protein
MPDAPSLTATIAFDGNQFDVDVDLTKPVVEVIKDALLAHNLDEDADECHLAGPDRLYFPDNPATEMDIDLQNGAMLSLRLPF